ncbi:hypothetical protein MB901379_01445 [Mycobacterium basiliense]|uniref:Uncharacterized protein n=1 Tax=Mycobacterium basiliense TaxID=2094119 RepID=A0A447GBR2_9MYCO|nr:hypothetical protein MB901379_01445 [Mycobacterium basiliense]
MWAADGCCDLRHAEAGPDAASRPGNFRNVIQNILYLFSLSPPRCSVSSTGRTQVHQAPPGFTGPNEQLGISIAKSTDMVVV